VHSQRSETSLGTARLNACSRIQADTNRVGVAVRSNFAADRPRLPLRPRGAQSDRAPFQRRNAAKGLPLRTPSVTSRPDRVQRLAEVGQGQKPGGVSSSISLFGDPQSPAFAAAYGRSC